MFKAVFKKGRLFVVMCFRILGFSPVTKGTESQISLYIPLNAKHRTSNSIKAQWMKEWQKLRETKVFWFCFQNDLLNLVSFNFQLTLALIIPVYRIYIFLFFFLGI